jgi:xanthine dehydrogenase YagS FAD-binding subunit
MRDFAYEIALDAAGAVAMLEAPDTAVIAGGTEILNWMRLGISAPARVVDIGRLPAFNTIERHGEEIVIGAGATLGQIGANALIREHAAVLAEACLKAASVQVRNRATLGGNVLQKTRCPYFRAEAPLPWGCNKRVPGSGCAARRGLNERHAILGWTDDCVTTQPSDPAVALACLDAVAEILGKQGRRTVPMLAFHLTQAEAAGNGGDAARLETRLAPGELITAYRLPLRAGERSAYVKVRERESYEYALVSAAASVRAENGVIGAARIALGSVAQKPWRLAAAEAALAGQPLTRERCCPRSGPRSPMPAPWSTMPTKSRWPRMPPCARCWPREVQHEHGQAFLAHRRLQQSDGARPLHCRQSSTGAAAWRAGRLPSRGRTHPPDRQRGRPPSARCGARAHPRRDA